MSLLKGLSILFIFSKNQLLDTLILRIVLWVSRSFNSVLILVIFFLLLALGHLCCWSSSSCRCRVRLFIWNVSIFLGSPVLLWTSLSGLPLLYPISFGLLGVHFHLFPETFWFLLWSHFSPIHCLIACYSISMFLSVWGFFPWDLFLVSVPYGWRECLIWFQFSGIFEVCFVSCHVVYL